MAGHLPYDLIFRDSQMPELDGFPASRQIRLLGGALRESASSLSPWRPPRTIVSSVWTAA